MGRIRVSNEWSDREQLIKDRLRSYRMLVTKHEACKDLFDRMQPALTAQVTADRVMSMGENRIEGKIVARIDLEQQMADSLQAMLDEIEAILQLINQLDGEEYVVILRRYTLNEGMEQVSESIHLSTRHCWRLHESAIRKLAKTCQ